MNEVNLKEILTKHLVFLFQDQGLDKLTAKSKAESALSDPDAQYVINAMFYACNETLKLASEYADCEEGAVVDLGIELCSARVNKSSILNLSSKIIK